MPIYIVVLTLTFVIAIVETDYTSLFCFLFN